MVKLSGPMSSFRASGTLAKLLTYSNQRGRPYLKKHSNTPNVNTAAQRITRDMFAWLANQWSQIGAPNRLLWEPRARIDHLTPYNAYVAFNTKRWCNFIRPSQSPAANQVLTPSTRPIGFCSWNGTQFEISTGIATLNDGWGFLIFAGPLPNYTPTRSHTIIMATDSTTPAQNFLWTPPAAVSTRFRLNTFSKDGKASATITSFTVNL